MLWFRNPWLNSQEDGDVFKDSATASSRETHELWYK